MDKSKGWGGKWTEDKLEAFSKYVAAYLKIMKKHPQWKTIYFDGFAGDGKRSKSKEDLYKQLSITQEEQEVYKCSAKRILSLPEELSFDYYYFIDSEQNLKHLEEEIKGYKDSHKIEFRPGDCNDVLLKLAQAIIEAPNQYAALIFLDPFGMQINWSSIEALKGTRSDIWILIPTGVIINRLLEKNGELRYSHKLESFFGLPEQEIRSFFYDKHKRLTLFGEEEVTRKVPKPIEKVAELYVKRLKTIWDHVTEKPLRLENSKKVPIFHLVFASNNKTAKNIASQIIKVN